MSLFTSIINKIISKYIIYTKILQWINFDSLLFFGKRINTFLKNFTDKAPYIDSDIDYDSLMKLEEIGKKYEISINKIPINSGTISLVFKGKIKQNNIDKDVAIKILRYKIKDKIDNAILNIEWLISFFEYIPIVKILNLGKIFKDAKTNLIEQTNFKNESENIQLFDKKLGKNSKIKTIKLIPELTMDNFITMEFVEGRSVFSLSEDEKKEFTYALSLTMFFSQMKKQLFHLDLHPGNILWTNDKKICYLDLGMIMKLKVEECNFILDFSNILICNNDNGVLLFENIINNYKDIIFKDEIHSNVFIKKIIEKRPNIFCSKDNLDIVMDIKFLIKELNSFGFDLNERINHILFGLLSFINIFINLGSDMRKMTNNNIQRYTQKNNFI